MSFGLAAHYSAGASDKYEVPGYSGKKVVTSGLITHVHGFTIIYEVPSGFIDNVFDGFLKDLDSVMSQMSSRSDNNTIMIVVVLVFLICAGIFAAWQTIRSLWAGKNELKARVRYGSPPNNHPNHPNQPAPQPAMPFFPFPVRDRAGAAVVNIEAGHLNPPGRLAPLDADEV